jgi:hypothetical protein
VNTLTWFNYDDTSADTIFGVYRSIPGIEFLFSSLSANPKFRFAATSPDIQEITIDTSNIDAAVASLNAGKGIKANKTSDGLSIQIRLTAQSNARLKFYSCTFIEDLNIAPNTIIVPGLNFQQLDTVAYIETVEPYEFEDVDGDFMDLYYVTTILDGKESIPSIEIAPLLPGVNYCITEARFIDVQGRPVHGVEMTAEPAYLDTQSMSANKVKVVSDAYGRVSLPLVQCQYYVLHIPAIGYNQFIKVPQADFLDITKWPASMDPEYTP